VTEPRISPLGDSAVTITLGDGISEGLSQKVVSEARVISESAIRGVKDVVPSYATVTVHYDPLRIGYADLRSRLLALASPAQFAANASGATQAHEIPVRYDGEDLQDVAARARMTVDDVIEIHSATEYRVFVIGFVPGFAYLGVLDARLVLPRRESPRKRVPAGSVAIAEAQTGIYPSETPGGWHLIGTTDVRLFDPARSQPALLAVGDRVRFVPA
jgi:KipI family sensor histidine kinase inhibitor